MASRHLYKAWLTPLLVLLIVACASAGSHFSVYQLLQYTQNGQNLGNTPASVNLPGAIFSSGDDFTRKIIVYPFEDLVKQVAAASELEADEFMQSITKSASAILVILPGPAAQQAPSTETVNEWIAAEQALLSYKWSIPIYFAHETQDVRDALQAMYTTNDEGLKQANSSPLDFILSDSIQFQTTTKAGSAVAQLTQTNIHAWIGGAGESLPIIAVAAHYDAFSSAPGAASGADANGSGVIGLFQIARLFSKLYSDQKTQAKYNLLFLLTDGGNTHFSGAKQWLAQADDRLLSSIELVLCLDSINSESLDSALYLHASRPEKNPIASKFYNAFRSEGKANGREFVVSLNKVNISGPSLWEHETFAKSKVFAATVSSLSSPRPRNALARSSLFDTRARLNEDVLNGNIGAIADVLASFMYSPLLKNPSLSVFDGELAVSSQLTDSVLSLMYPEDDLSNTRLSLRGNSSSLVPAFESLLSRVASEVTIQRHLIPASALAIGFFSDEWVLQMNTYIVKPYLFDIFLALVMIVYLSGLYVAIKGRASIAEFTSIVDHIKIAITGGKKKTK